MPTVYSTELELLILKFLIIKQKTVQVLNFVKSKLNHPRNKIHEIFSVKKFLKIFSYVKHEKCFNFPVGIKKVKSKVPLKKIHMHNIPTNTIWILLTTESFTYYHEFNKLMLQKILHSYFYMNTVKNLAVLCCTNAFSPTFRHNSVLFFRTEHSFSVIANLKL